MHRSPQNDKSLQSRIDILQSLSQKIRESANSKNLQELRGLLTAANSIVKKPLEAPLPIQDSLTSRQEDAEISALFEKEIQELKTKNKELLKTVDRLHDQLRNAVKDKETALKAAVQYEIQDELQVYGCKEEVDLDAYKQLQFLKCTIEIRKERLLIRQEQIVLQQFPIYTLESVKYGQMPFLLLQFRETEDDISNLFINFPDYARLKTWDSALFLAFHTANAVRHDRLFDNAGFPKKIKEKLSSKPSQTELVKKLITKKLEYDEIKAQLDEQSVQVMKKVQKSREKESLSESNLRKEVTPIKTFVISQQRDSLQSVDLQEEKRRKQKAEEEQKQIKYKNAVVSLQTGFVLTKYSKDGIKPHTKIVSLSPNEELLCWAEEDKPSDYKSIPISSVLNVMPKKIGEGIRKHVSDPDQEEFCVIDYKTKDNKVKFIELGCDDINEINQFSTSFQTIFKSHKR